MHFDTNIIPLPFICSTNDRLSLHFALRHAIFDWRKGIPSNLEVLLKLMQMRRRHVSSNLKSCAYILGHYLFDLNHQPSAYQHQQKAKCPRSTNLVYITHTISDLTSQDALLGAFPLLKRCQMPFIDLIYRFALNNDHGAPKKKIR